MDAGIVGAVRAIFPKVPLISRTALLHTIGYSEQSKHWDLRTELLVSVLRSFLADPPMQIAKLQRLSMKAGEVKGRIWISRVTLPTPAEDSVRQSLFSAIEGLKEDGSPRGGFTEAEMLPVEAEWTGYRADATPQSLEPSISEEEKYCEMMKEATSPITVLYLHGGALYLMDPATHRPTCKKIAKITKGRCLSVRYRLAPQGPFPSALLDALVAYFTLLYPPPGSWHTPVKPEHIVVAGDSAGGNLSLALLQTLLEFQRQNLKVTWNGEEREVPLPAGVATCSAWLDITHSMPSCEANAKYDYLPSRSINPSGYEFPSDSVWPASPPRNNLYAEDALLSHPLVSPVATKDWTGSCPLFMGTGEELLTDEDKYVSACAAKQGVTVVFEEYETMPHCFAMMLEHLPIARRFFTGWVGFMRDVVENPEVVKTKGTIIQAKSLKEVDVEVANVSIYSEEEIKRWMAERVDRMTGKRPDQLAKL